MTHRAEHHDPRKGIARDETQTFAGTGTPRSTGPTLHRGKLLGRYVVLYALGSGGMGTVYAAFDPELERKVALKVLRHDLRRSAGAAAQAKLRREAQAIAKLAHPNVVAVHDVGRVEDQLFIAMEIIEGSTLGQWLDRPGVNWRQVIEVFLQAGRGLAAAHDQGLIHRDFKPSNVMVGADGRVRVLDFGLARAADSPLPHPQVDREDSMSSGTVPVRPSIRPQMTTSRGLGTPAYVAPELLTGASPDARSDQYSFCLSFYESLHSELPGATTSGRNQQPRIPRWLRQLLARGLSPDPDQRFKSMRALLAALEKGAHRRARQWLVVAVLATATVTSFGLWRSFRPLNPMLCQGAERRLEGIWDEQRKAAGLAAFTAVGEPFVMDTWEQVSATLDSYTANWTRQNVEACEATHLRGEQSEQLLDLQVACLDRRLQEVEAATDLLLEADEQIAYNAIKLANLPGDLGLCSDREALLADLPPPPNPETASRVSEIRALLVEARALDNAGKYHQAHSVAISATKQAADLPYLPIQGEALFRLSQEAARAGQRAQMTDTLLEVARIALTASHDELLARALTHLILASWLRGEGAEAHRWADLAEGAIEGLARPHELISQRFFFLGMVANMEEKPEAAIAFFQQSAETNLRTNPLDHLVTLNNLGVAHRLLGQLDEARAKYQESLEVTRQAYGARHPALAGIYVSLGELSLDQGDFEAALSSYRDSLTISTAATSAADPHRSFALIGIGRALLGLGRPTAALEPLAEAVRLGEAQTLDPLTLSISRFQLARAQWDSGADRGRARGLAVQARNTQQTLGERAAAELTASETWLAEHR